MSYSIFDLLYRSSWILRKLFSIKSKFYFSDFYDYSSDSFTDESYFLISYFELLIEERESDLSFSSMISFSVAFVLVSVLLDKRNSGTNFYYSEWKSYLLICNKFYLGEEISWLELLLELLLEQLDIESSDSGNSVNSREGFSIGKDKMDSDIFDWENSYMRGIFALLFNIIDGFIIELWFPIIFD